MFNLISEVVLRPDHSRTVPHSDELVAVVIAAAEFSDLAVAEFGGERIFVEVTKIDGGLSSYVAWYATQD